MSDGNIFEEHVKLGSTLLQRLQDFLRDLLSLRDQLFGIVLGNNGLEHLTTDGEEHSVGVVLTNVVEDSVQVLLIGSEQDSQRHLNLLQILGTGS